MFIKRDEKEEDERRRRRRKCVRETLGSSVSVATAACG